MNYTFVCIMVTDSWYLLACILLYHTLYIWMEYMLEWIYWMYVRPVHVLWIMNWLVFLYILGISFPYTFMSEKYTPRPHSFLYHPFKDWKRKEDWLIDWYVDLLIDMLVLWLVCWLIGQSINWSSHWVVSWLICLLIDQLIGWSVSWLIDPLIGWSIDWVDKVVNGGDNAISATLYVTIY